MAQTEWKAWAIRTSWGLRRYADNGIELYASRRMARAAERLDPVRGTAVRVTVSIDSDQGEKP